MSRDLATATTNLINDSVVYPFFAIDLLFDTNPLYLWTGLGDLFYGGNTYVGTGTLLTVSDVEETVEIAARGATLSLSGVAPEALSLVLTEFYQGRQCKIYFGLFDRENEIEPTVFTEVFTGYMDQMNIQEGADSCSIELKVENKLIDLERARVRRYSSGYQKSVYPNDKGFDFVEDLQDKQVVWGRNG